MKESFKISCILPASPSQVYEAWLDSNEHEAMTGGGAECNDVVGDAFEAWDGYIEGRNLELVKNQRIVQSWRTVEFDEEDEYSRLEIHLSPTSEGTLLTLIHSNIPEGQTQYEQGWVDNYFDPMKVYFETGSM